MILILHPWQMGIQIFVDQMLSGTRKGDIAPNKRPPTLTLQFPLSTLWLAGVIPRNIKMQYEKNKNATLKQKENHNKSLHNTGIVHASMVDWNG